MLKVQQNNVITYILLCFGSSDNAIEPPITVKASTTVIMILTNNIIGFELLFLLVEFNPADIHAMQEPGDY